MPGPDYVDLYLTVDPKFNTVKASYAATTSGHTGPITTVGKTQKVPSDWFTNSTTKVAVGLISTSRGTAPTFPATWDFLEGHVGRGERFHRDRLLFGQPRCSARCDIHVQRP
jgi:hypothetical protein